MYTAVADYRMEQAFTEFVLAAHADGAVLLRLTELHERLSSVET